MKASYYNRYGGIEVIEYGELPEPALSKDKIKIRVKAVSLNPVDYKIRQGVLRLLTGRKFPKFLGADFSGIVEETGTEISGFIKGDRIYGNIPALSGNTGALCELVVVAPKRIRKIPENMSFEQAASLPVAALTAQTGKRKSGNLKNKTFLVNGATGGVGHFAVQIAKADGAIVTAVCGPKNIDLAKTLGADDVIDYSKEDISTMNRKFDVIFDSYGKMNYKTVRKLLNKKGLYLSTLFFPPRSLSAVFIRLIFNKKLTSANMRANPEDYLEIETIYKEGKLNPVIEHVFPLEKTRDAFALLENGKPRGKVIVTV
jgi:NADPH:quinone reductase-like Zn-dependent oxidoreductase